MHSTTHLARSESRLAIRFRLIVGLALAIGIENNVARAATLSLHLSADGAQTPQFYVGIVAAHEPLSKPLNERVTDRSDLALSVPDGQYRLVVGAKGFATYVSDVFAAVGEVGKQTPVRLTPLATLSGRILDNENRPIPNARIGLPGKFRLDLPSTLSERAETYLSANDVVESDETGSFLVPVHALGTSYIFIEADGYAPTLLPRASATDAGVGEVRLDKGASLEIRFLETPGPYRLLHLVPRKVQLPPTLSVSSAAAIWTRVLSGSVQRWPSLIPGTYDVCVTPLDDLAESAVPRIVGHVDLKAGDTQSLAMTLPTAQALPERDLNFKLPGPDDLKKIQVVRYLKGNSEQVQATSDVQSAQVSVFAIRSGCVSGAIYSVTGEGWIATAGPIVPPCEEPTDLHPQLRGTVELRVRPPLGRTLPAAGVLESRACDAPQGTEATKVPVEIPSDGIFNVSMPAGCREAILRAGMLSLSRPLRIEVLSHETTHLAPLSLRMGASLTTRVLDAKGRPVVDAVVRLYRTASVDRSGGDVARVPPVAESLTDTTGSVILAGIPDDTYVLAVAALAGGHALSNAIKIRPEEHLYLDDVVLADHE